MIQPRTALASLPRTSRPKFDDTNIPPPWIRSSARSFLRQRRHRRQRRRAAPPGRRAAVAAEGLARRPLGAALAAEGHRSRPQRSLEPDFHRFQNKISVECFMIFYNLEMKRKPSARKERIFFSREASMKSEKREKKNENRKMKTPKFSFFSFFPCPFFLIFFSKQIAIPTHIFLQNLASIQPRTSPSKLDS